MANASELKPEELFHGLFVGPSGAGKTCASVTVGDTEEKASRVYIFDVDTRIKGILGLPVLADKVKAGLIEFGQYSTAKDPLEALEKDIDVVHARVLRKEIDTVVLSSTTSLNAFCEEAALDCLDIKHNVIRGKKMTQVQDYGYIARVDKDLIVHELAKWPCNVVIECHLKDDGFTDEKGDYITTGKTFNLPGKLAHEVPSWFDETYEFFVDDVVPSNPRRKVKFQSRLAKTTFSGLPIELDWTELNFFRTLCDIRSGKLTKAGKKPEAQSTATTQNLSGLAALKALGKR